MTKRRRDPDRSTHGPDLAAIEAAVERTALGPLRLEASRRTVTGDTVVMLDAARNLLTKARRRLAAGEDVAAAALVQRAARLRFATEQRLDPAGVVAQSLVTDAIGARRVRGGDWLGDVLGLLDRPDAPGAAEVGRGLAMLLDDRTGTAEARDRIRTALDRLPFPQPLIEQDDAARTAALLALLRAAEALETAASPA